jgi:AraC-like DNA-binding protein
MEPMQFSTKRLPVREQRAAWSEWFQPVFDVVPEDREQPGFDAEYSTWMIGDVNVTWAGGPAARTLRTPAHIRHSPIDHWVITYSKHGATALSTKGGQIEAAAGVPFVWSLGQASESSRTEADRIQLYLPRDSFSQIASALDLATGRMLDTPSGNLLADYMVMLWNNLATLTPQDGGRLRDAIQAMVAACVVPSVDRLAAASPQIELTLRERVRRVIRKHLRSASLDLDTLCREAAMSRSKLYRVLEDEGGVANYIQHCRLSESFSILCNASDTSMIGKIAESLCFADASSFSRAFRREFGMSPSDVRASALAGLRPIAQPRRTADQAARSFRDCLHV